MAAPNAPRHGSLQFWPRKRAKREIPRIRHWPNVANIAILGFPGYKVGMLHVIVIDNDKNSLTKGQEIMVPVTVIETPPIKIFSVRFYKKSAEKKYVYKDLILSQDESLRRVVSLPKKDIINSMVAKFNEMEKELNDICDIRVLVFTQPKKTGIGKKKPEIVELSLGGSVKDKYKFVKEHIGKEITISEVFKSGMFVDVHAVTKGRGIQGPIKRFKLNLKSHKTEKGQRRPGSLGPLTPGRVRFTVPLAGQTGYNLRTEYNKEIMLISNDVSLVQPKGGFHKYGVLRNSYVLIKGSIPGHVKRLVVLTYPIRNTPPQEAKRISMIVKERYVGDKNEIKN
ncbi:MAG: 50S ribosomal protein L3 [Candidatus Woesearchaeota archaeon]